MKGDLPAVEEGDRLRAQLERLIAANQNLSALLLTSDARSGVLLKLLVTVRSLIESRDASSALEGVCDILVNVVGTSDFVMYSLDAETDALVPIAGEGASFEIASPVGMAGSWLGDVVRTGEVLVTLGRSRSTYRRRMSNVAAVVPLKVLDRVVGAIVIARVLAHRDLLDVCDRDILGLLGAYAATAIIAADQREQWHHLPVLAQ